MLKALSFQQLLREAQHNIAASVSMVQRKKTNPFMNEFLAQAEKSKAKFWQSVARNLKRPRRTSYEVNLHSLEGVADDKLTNVVPGTVLGTGEVTKKLNVAAWRFSGAARQKIEKAGGKCWTLNQLWETNKDGKGVKLVG